MATTWPSITSMANRSNKLPGPRRLRAVAAALAAIAALWPEMVTGCPFCTPLEPTLCQWRHRATVTALAEVADEAVDDRTRLKLHRLFAGQQLVGERSHLTAKLDRAARRGTLLLVFATAAQGQPLAALDWHAAPVDETSYAYFGRAPDLQVAGPKRLEYFARFLEHPNATIAQDAYLEFAHAPFDDVAQAAHALPVAQARAWIVDAGLPAYRKGFYGLVLGLARNERQRRANAELLRQLIIGPQDDFRAGFDGMLAGYLLLEGPAGLELVESRYLANPAAADGDVRHALAAVRFYREYGRDIPRPRLHAAVRHLLARAEFAEPAITDLARWQDWDALAEVVDLYGRDEYARPPIDRAIVGYLLACPSAEAARQLARLRKLDPRGIAAAEAVLSQTGSVPRSE